jgi:hypothetical protein
MKIGILLIGLCLLFSCHYYQPPQIYVFDKSRTINKPFEEVWNSVIEWFAKNNTPIRNLDKSSGFIASEFNLKPNASHCDCGAFDDSPYFNGIFGNFNIHLKKINDKTTTITINTFYKSNNDFLYTVIDSLDNEVKYFSIFCNSMGTLEKEILDYVDR